MASSGLPDGCDGWCWNSNPPQYLALARRDDEPRVFWHLFQDKPDALTVWWFKGFEILAELPALCSVLALYPLDQNWLVCLPWHLCLPR